MIENKHLLVGIHSDLESVLLHASKVTDFRILSGKRSEKAQDELFLQGKTKISNSKEAPHVKGLAVDLVPLPFEGWGDIEKNKTYTSHEAGMIAKQRGKFYYLAGVLFSVAYDFKINLRHGGDWDKDGNYLDQTFDDLVHFEVIV